MCIRDSASITDGNGNYSIAGATYGVFSDKDCTKQLATLTTDENGNTDIAEVKAGTVYIKELYAPAGYKVCLLYTSRLISISRFFTLPLNAISSVQYPAVSSMEYLISSPFPIIALM